MPPGSRPMRTSLRILGVVVALALLLVGSHLAFIEIGREVVVLRTPRPDGSWKETRLWIVDEGDACWLHSAGRGWIAQFEGDPVVELERGGERRRYRARAMPGPHPRVHELLRAKYGLADRWVRFLGPDDEDTVAVRLEPLSGETE